MNLLDYLPAPLINLAHQVAQNKLVAVSAPRDSEDLRLLVHEHPLLRMQWAMLFGTPLESPDLLTIHALSEVVQGGAKVLKPSVEVCRVLSQIELHLHLKDYAQPYHGMGVVIPKTLIHQAKDLFVACWWRPGLGMHTGFYLDDVLVYQTIGPHWPGTLEEFLDVRDESDWSTWTPERQVVARQVARICLNLGLFAMDRGVRVTPLDPRSEKRKKRARDDPRMAELAARDAQEVIIQDLDLVLRTSPVDPALPPESQGRRQPMNRRRGHWKMQAFGPGRSQRRQIYVSPYLVNVNPDQPGSINTTLT